jgi:K+-transporting ATPase ATPase B chain
MGNRQADRFIPVDGVKEADLAAISQLASLADETPEGRSIVVLAKSRYGLRAETLETSKAKIISFSAKTRISGIDYEGRKMRKGAVDAIRAFAESLGGEYPKTLDPVILAISQSGGTPLLVCDGPQILGVIHLKDVIKGGIAERFAKLREMGIRCVMITGDNALTAAAIAAEAGVDDYIAEATPEIKLEYIRHLPRQMWASP